MTAIVKSTSKSISTSSTKEEILEWLVDECKRVEIIAISVWLMNHHNYAIPTSGTMDQLVYGLRKVKTKFLFDAIDEILDTTDEEEEDDRDSEDDDESIDEPEEDEDDDDENEEDED